MTGSREIALPFVWRSLILLVSLFQVVELIGQHRPVEWDSQIDMVNGMKPGAAKAEVLHELSRSLREQRTPEALKYAEKAIVMARDFEQDSLLVRALLNKGWCTSHIGEIQLGIDIYNEALQLAESLENPELIAPSLNMLAGAYQGLGDFERSVSYYIGAAKAFEAAHNDMGAARIHNNIGTVYHALGGENIPDAIEHYTKALETERRLGDTSTISLTCLNLGDAYVDFGKPEEAERYYAQAIEFVTKYSLSGLYRYNVFMGSGEFYLFHGETERGLKYTSEAIAIIQQMDEKHLLAGPFYILAKYHRELGQYDTAMDYALQSLEYAQGFQWNTYVRDDFLLLSELAALKGDSSAAYDYHLKYAIVEDSILNQEKIKTIKNLQFKYQTALKEQELVTAKADATLNRQALWFAILGLFLMLIVGVLLYRTNLARKKANALLAEQRDQLEQRNLEKEALLKEIHHRVKNNLQVISSLLNLQSANLSDEAALDAIKEGQNRVKSIALIHQKLYQTEDLSRVDFQDYSEQLASFLSATFRAKGKSVTTSIEANGIELDIDTAVPLGLIINELLTNAYKYAFEQQDLGEIYIRLDEAADGYQLTVRDNGQGLPEDLDIAKSKSLGMKLVHILSRQLKGSVEWRNDPGACFEVFFRETGVRKQSA